MDKPLVAMIWILSLFAMVFLGHEIAFIKHNLDRQVANDKLQMCNKIIAGNTYE